MGHALALLQWNLSQSHKLHFQSAETGEKTAGSLFLCGIMKGKTLTLTWEVSEIEVISCLPVQPPGHSSWKAVHGFCVCFLLNDLSIGRRVVEEEREMQMKLLFGDKKRF